MGNYENMIKVEEMRRLLEEGREEKAQQVLDTIDTTKIKSVSDLNLFATVYLKNERYEEAFETLLKVYDKSKTRRVLFQMTEVSIFRKNLADAKRFYEEYVEHASNDFYQYIFKYKIQKLQGAPLDDQIQTLEILKKAEYIEEWAYELAKLYHKNGNKEKCIKECTDICLWFGQGIYVDKAKMLKLIYQDEEKKPSIIEELRKKAKANK